jgi:1,4-dihydroxy-2-naphthoate octaprenyltransferase
VLVGSVFAASLKSMDWLLFVLVLSGSMAIQIGTNLTDEYSDHRNSGDSGKFLAPHKIIQRGLLSERAVLAGMIVAFGYAVVAGLIIVALTGWPILAIGVMSVAAAFFYSGGPYPLGNLGLGEPVVFLFMGPLTVMGAFYAQVETFTWGSFWVSLPVAFIVTAILHCNNLRDVDEDHEVGKRSIAMALGPTPSRWLYAGLLAAAYGTIIALTATDVISQWGLAGLLPAPWAVGSVRMLLAADDRPAMNRVMVRSAKIHGWTGLTLATGLLYATL